MKKWTLLVLVVLAVGVFSGCSSTKDRILGIWEFRGSYTGVMTIMLSGEMKFFYKFKGTQDANFDRKMGTWTLDGKRLTLNFKGGGKRDFDIVEIEDNALQMNDLDKNMGGMKMFRKVKRF